MIIKELIHFYLINLSIYFAKTDNNHVTNNNLFIFLKTFCKNKTYTFVVLNLSNLELTPALTPINVI